MKQIRMQITEQYIMDSFHRLINKLVEREMKPRMLPSGDLIYRIEIHVIDAIGRYPETNLTDLSKILGVTKGAVSQKIKLLEKKQYINKIKKNNKEIYFELTDKGKQVFKGHNEFHKEFNERIFSKIDINDEKQMNIILGIIKFLNEHLETI